MLLRKIAVNNLQAVGAFLHALTPFATAINPELDTITSTCVAILNNIQKRSIKDKLVKISEQFSKCELNPNIMQTIGE